jgi:predicted transcriptional regulator
VRRSKLERYEAILGSLVNKPLGIDRIAYKTNIECAVVNQHLGFLIRNQLVEERIQGSKMRYALTERGMTVFKTLDFQRYLKGIFGTLREIDEAMQTVRDISEKSEEKDKY